MNNRLTRRIIALYLFPEVQSIDAAPSKGMLALPLQPRQVGALEIITCRLTGSQCTYRPLATRGYRSCVTAQRLLRSKVSRRDILFVCGELFSRPEIRVGHSRRREARDIAESIAESKRTIVGVTLGKICAANVVKLDVACHRCSRRGRYRVTRLIDQHGPKWNC